MNVPRPRSLRPLGAVTWVLALGPSLLVPVPWSRSRSRPGRLRSRGCRATSSRAAAAPMGGWSEGLAVLHILLAPACGGSLVFQRSLVAEGRFGKDECAMASPFAHSSRSRAPGSRADPQDSAPPHSLREERMCNLQARTPRGPRMTWRRGSVWRPPSPRAQGPRWCAECRGSRRNSSTGGDLHRPSAQSFRGWRALFE